MFSQGDDFVFITAEWLAEVDYWTGEGFCPMAIWVLKHQCNLFKKFWASQMMLSETVRTFILENPMLIPTASTITSFFFDQLVSNYKLIGLVVLAVSVSIFMLASVYIRHRDRSSSYLIYVSGLFLFFIALVMRLMKNTSDTEVTSLTKALLSGLVGTLEDRERAEVFTHKIFKASSPGNMSRIFMPDTYKAKDFDEVTSKHNHDDTIPKPGVHSFINPIKPIGFDATLYRTKENAKAVAMKECLPDAKLEKADNTPDNQKPQKNRTDRRGNMSVVTKKPRNVSINPQVSNHREVTKTIEPATKNASSKSTQDTGAIENKKALELADTKRPESSNSFLSGISSQLNLNRSANDQFIKNVLTTLNTEFTANNSISPYFQEINRAIDKTTEEARRFDSNLRKFFGMSAKIEKEMRSFNASIENCNIFRVELLNHLKSMSSLKNVLENLNYRDGTDSELNNIFRVKSNSPRGLEVHEDNAYARHSSMLNAFWVFLVLQFALGLLLIYSAIVRNDSIFIARLLVVICLVLDLLSSIFFMIQAHFLDKNCILGHVSGCESNFSVGFADFAASTNIDLKSNSSKRLENVSRSLEKIQYRTESTVAALRSLFEENPVAEFEKRSIYFINLFGKIRFVEDDFDELTHAKVNKSEFFKLIETMELELSQIHLNLKIIDFKKLLDFYAREMVFLNFVKNEKASVLISIENQIEGNKLLESSQKTSRCEQKKANLCYQKDTFDFTFMTLLFGPIILMVLLLF